MNLYFNYGHYCYVTFVTLQPEVEALDALNDNFPFYSFLFTSDLIGLIHNREGLNSKKRVTKLVLVVISVFIGRIKLLINLIN